MFRSTIRKNVSSVRRSQNHSEHTPHIYLSHAQIKSLLDEKNEALNKTKLELLNFSRQVTRQKEKLTMHKRFLVALGQENVPRLRQLISVCMKQRRSISFITRRLHDAAMGLYAAKGYNEDDIELAYLVLKIGGPRLLKVLQHEGLPSVTTVRVRSKSMGLTYKFEYNVYDDVMSTLTTNLENIVRDYGGPGTVWSLKCDEVAVLPRLRWRISDNVVYGLCIEHSELVYFNNMDDVNEVSRRIDATEIHFAKESLVFVLVRLGGAEHATYPLLSLPICSHSSSDLQRKIFTKVEGFFKPSARQHGILINIGTDGDATRRRLLHELYYEKPSRSVPSSLYAELMDLELLDLPKSQITVNKDAKHLIKRLRNRIINTGIGIGPFQFDSVLLQRFIKDRSLLNPADRQNVPLAHKLLVAISRVSCQHESNFSTQEKVFLPELRILGALADALCALYAKYEKSLQDILVDLSLAAHILLYVYREKGTGFIGNQLYHDLQKTINDIFATVAKFRAWCPGRNYYITQAGSDECEILFAIVRTLTHDSNCDLLQLNERLECSATTSKIFSKHPEWKRISRRLQVSDADGIDRTNPAAWTGELRPREVDLKRAWDDGRRQAEVLLNSRSWHRTPLQHENAISMLKPNGKTIGVTESGADSEQDDDDESDVDCVDEDYGEFEELIDHETSDFSSFIVVRDEADCHTIHKASVLRQMFNGGKVSKDRLRRVRGLSYSPASSTCSSADEAMSFIVGDPFVTVFENVTNERVTKCLAILIARSVDDDGSTATGPVLVLENTSGEYLVWNKQTSSKSVTVNNFAPVGFDYDPVNDVTRFGVSEAASLFRLLNTDNLVKTKFDCLPYKHKDLYISVEIGLQQPSYSGTRKTDLWSCSVLNCGKEIEKKSFRSHIGSHILSGDLPTEVCGYCGAMPACDTWLERSSGAGESKTVSANSNCLKFVKFSQKCAAKSTSTGRCTNRPEWCNADACKSVCVWTYNMETHYQKYHTGKNVPSGFLISENERKVMKSKLKKRK